MKKYLFLLFTVLAFTVSLDAQVANQIDPETQMKPGAPGEILQTNAAGDAWELVPIPMSPIQEVSNGLTLNVDTVELGGTLNKPTEVNVNGFPFSIKDIDHNFTIGDGIGPLSLVNDGVFLSKENTGNSNYIGVGDASGMGLTSNTTMLIAGDVATQNASLAILSKESASISNRNATHSGTLGINSSIAEPSSGLDLKYSDKELGFYAIDATGTSGKAYSNIYWADKTNGTADWSRWEASNQGSSGMWRWDRVNQKDVFITLDDTGYRFYETDNGDLFKIDQLGETVFSSYPKNRDDTALETPINFLFTGTNGELLSAPSSAIQLDKSIDTFIELTGGETTVTLNGAPASESDIIVYLNGQLLTWKGSTPDWTLSGNVLTLTSYVGVAGHFIEVLAR